MPLQPPPSPPPISNAWLRWSIIFALVSLVASLEGFGAITGMTETAAKWCFFIFVIIALLQFMNPPPPQTPTT